MIILWLVVEDFSVILNLFCNEFSVLIFLVSFKVRLLFDFLVFVSCCVIEFFCSFKFVSFNLRDFRYMMVLFVVDNLVLMDVILLFFCRILVVRYLFLVKRVIIFWLVFFKF